MLETKNPFFKKMIFFGKKSHSAENRPKNPKLVLFGSKWYHINSKYPKNQKGDPFVSLKNSPINVISGTRYIRLR